MDSCLLRPLPTAERRLLTQRTFLSPSSGGRKSKIEVLVDSVPGWGSLSGLSQGRLAVS